MDCQVVINVTPRHPKPVDSTMVDGTSMSANGPVWQGRVWRPHQRGKGITTKVEESSVRVFFHKLRRLRPYRFDHDDAARLGHLPHRPSWLPSGTYSTSECLLHTKLRPRYCGRCQEAAPPPPRARDCCVRKQKNRERHPDLPQGHGPYGKGRHRGSEAQDGA